MKYGLLIVFLLCIGFVNAASDVCSDKGMGHTVSSWKYDAGFVSTSGSGVDVYGGPKKAYWNSTMPVEGLVYKSGNRTYTMDGGLNGTIPKTTLKNDIQTINFCSTNEVPEFGAVGAALAGLGVLGVYVYRKK